MEHMERSWSLDQQVDVKATGQPLTSEDLFADEHERLYRAALYVIVGSSHEAEELNRFQDRPPAIGIGSFFSRTDLG
jgi:hypothetical protein